jgi:quaternary ammonium compound-resistance protein SugE
MSWLVLALSGVLEAVWAHALGRSEGLTKLAPSLLFGAALVVSMGGLAYALRTVPIGVGYAVWVGIGAAVTVGYSMATGAEAVSVAKLLLLAALVGCIAGLKLLH